MIENVVEGCLRAPHGRGLAINRPHDAGRCQVKLIEQESVGTLHLDTVGGERIVWEVLEVGRDDNVCAPDDCRSDDVPVSWVGNADGWYQLLPARH